MHQVAKKVGVKSFVKFYRRLYNGETENDIAKRKVKKFYEMKVRRI